MTEGQKWQRKTAQRMHEFIEFIRAQVVWAHIITKYVWAVLRSNKFLLSLYQKPVLWCILNGMRCALWKYSCRVHMLTQWQESLRNSKCGRRKKNGAHLRVDLLAFSIDKNISLLSITFTVWALTAQFKMYLYTFFCFLVCGSNANQLNKQIWADKIYIFILNWNLTSWHKQSFFFHHHQHHHRQNKRNKKWAKQNLAPPNIIITKWDKLVRFEYVCFISIIIHRLSFWSI